MPNTFTPEQIAQILEEFFKVVGTRQYIGARYVPIFGRKGEDSIEWDNTGTYEPLSIVLYQGNSYTSRQFVPVGVEITNQEFWALTGNYNAQIEQYRQAVLNLAEDINDISALIENLTSIIPASEFNAENTIKDYVDALGSVIPWNNFNSEYTVKNYIDNTVRENAINEYTLFSNYSGRLASTDETRNFQGATMLNGDKAIVCMAHSDNDPDLSTVIYEISLRDFGEITAIYTRDYGHTNDICYNENSNNIYVVRRATTTDRTLLVCNTFDYSITNEVTAPYILLGCTYDRITRKMYCYGRDLITNNFVASEFDYINNEFGDIFFNMSLTAITNKITFSADETLGGTQGMCAYNDEIYILFSNTHGSLLRIYKDSDNIDIYNLPNVVSIYPILEYEGCEFDENGNIFTVGKSNLKYGPEKFGVISFVNMHGKLISGFHANTETLSLLNRYNIHVDTSLDPNYQLYQVGESGSKFATASEALKLASVTSDRWIRVTNQLDLSNAISAQSDPIKFPLQIRPVNDSGKADLIIHDRSSTLYLINQLYVQSMRISLKILSTMRYPISVAGGRVMFRQCDFTVEANSASSSFAQIVDFTSFWGCTFTKLNAAADAFISFSDMGIVTVQPADTDFANLRLLQLGVLKTA